MEQPSKINSKGLWSQVTFNINLVSSDKTNNIIASLMYFIQGKTTHGWGRTEPQKQGYMPPKGSGARVSFIEPSEEATWKWGLEVWDFPVKLASPIF